jgi:hypothetical protein
MRHAIGWRADGWKPRFFTIWSGQVFSLLGSQLVQFALVWRLTLQTGSGTVLTTATMAAIVPQVALGPFVGTLVDRWDRGGGAGSLLAAGPLDRPPGRAGRRAGEIP